MFQINNEKGARLGIFSAFQDYNQPLIPETNLGRLVNGQALL